IITKRGVMDNLNDGLKKAGQMFGINTAADVANLVARAFSTTNSNKNKPDLFSLIQKGLQSSPLATTSSEDAKHLETKGNLQQQPEGSKEVIGNTIMGTTKPIGGRFFNKNPTSTQTSNSEDYVGDNAETGPEEKYGPNDHEPRSAADPTTIEWFLQNPSNKMKRILKDATHTNLADKLTDMIASYETEQGQGSCLKMLICKSSPFIWGMQKSIRKHIQPHIGQETENTDDDNENKQETDDLSKEKPIFNTQHFFVHMPSIEEFQNYSEKCEKLYSIHCNTTVL
ncbi:hypothetical protein DOY81_010686, partial [Sarcophaga bullata]